MKILWFACELRKITESQVEGSAKANIVEHGQSSRGHKGNKGHKFNGKMKNKGVDLGPRKGGVKKKGWFLQRKMLQL